MDLRPTLCFGRFSLGMNVGAGRIFVADNSGLLLGKLEFDFVPNSDAFVQDAGSYLW